MGNVATLPLRLGDPHRCRAGAQNQKWPICGQCGYVTIAVSGIPTASKREGKSDVAHLWAMWLRHPCRLGDPHRCKAGGQNQKWPTCGQSGYVTPAVPEIPTASKRGGIFKSGPLVGNVATSPLRLGDPHRCRGGAKIRSGPLVDNLATSALPSRGSPLLQSGGGNSEVAHLWAMWLRYPCRLGDPHRFRAEGQNQKWRTCGQSGYVTPAVLGIPTAAERGAKSEVAHLWARLLRQSCRLGDLHCFKAGGIFKSGPLVGNVATSPLRLGDPHRCRGGAKIRSGTLAGNVATSPLPSRGSPPLQSGGQNQKWPTCGQCGYVTPAVSGIPTASERGGEFRSGPLVGNVATLPLRFGDPHRCIVGGKFRSGPLVGNVATSPLPSRGSPPLQSGGAKSEVAHLWAMWLRHPCHLGDPNRCRAGSEIRSGPLVGKVATSPLPSRGSPPLHSGGQNQTWRTCGQCGYVTLAVSGIPTASQRGGYSKVAHLWAMWLRHPCVSGIPTAAERGAKSEVAHLWARCLRHPCVSGIPTAAERGGQNQKWPICGQCGYVTPAVSGIPTASERGAKSEVAHLWARCLRHPCVSGIPTAAERGGKIRSGPFVGNVATSPLRSRGSPPLQSGGQNQKWPTCGQCGYVTPTVSGIPTAADRGAKSEVAHLWARCLRHPYRLGDPHRCRAGGKIRSGPLVGKVPVSPLSSRGSLLLQSGGQNQKWPTCGQSGYVSPAVSGIPTASERGGNLEVAHLWAIWLCHPCRLGDPHRCRAGRQNQKWPTCGQGGYVAPAVTGIPTASERGGNSEVAHLWAMWLRHPCVSGIPTAAERGGKIRSGPLVGKVPTSPLPSRGSPLLQSRG